MMDDQHTIFIPGGCWIEGVRHQEVEMRALNGHDQEYILEAKKSQSPAEWATTVLELSLIRIGPLNPVTSDHIRLLTVGDREALLLHVRRITLGDRLDCIVNCPNDNCNEKMSLDLAISELLLPPYENAREFHEATIGENGNNYQVTFRLPTGLDQEQAARIAKGNPLGAAEHLMRSCILDINNDDNEEVGEVPLSIKEKLPSIISELDPQAELTLNLTCTACESHFNTILDAGTYFSREIETSLNQLLSEIHLLAFHYHWSEKEIMSMKTSKRHQYRDLLLNALSEERYQ